MIPISCIDDFWDDPDSIRDYALNLNFDSSNKEHFIFPGLRTNCLSTIDKDFYNLSIEKLLSCFFDSSLPVYWKGTSYFQKIYTFNQDKHHAMNGGWVHVDGETTFAAVVYLNKDTCLDSGTSILHPKKGFDPSSLIKSDYAMRDNLYRDVDVNPDLYTQSITNHNNKFDITLEFKNRYNRMVAYNGETWHKESCFWVPEEFRLTQVFFMKLFENSPTPRLNLQYS